MTDVLSTIILLAFVLFSVSIYQKGEALKDRGVSNITVELDSGAMCGWHEADERTVCKSIYRLDYE